MNSQKLTAELENIGPEKEPIFLSVDTTESVSPDYERLIKQIQAVAEQHFYHWKTFPFKLPTSAETSKPINFQDLYRPPSFDELTVVAINSDGQQKKLTNTQLQSIRRNGEFEVPSVNFPGHVHLWELSQILQKGLDQTHNSLLNNWARTPSVPDLNRTPGLDDKIKEEYLIAELACSPEHEERFNLLCSHIQQHLLRHANHLKLTVEAQQIPYLYVTPNGKKINLSLFSKEIIQKALPIVERILKKEGSGWFPELRQQLISDLREENLTDREIEEQVNDAAMKEYLLRVHNSILANDNLSKLGDSIPQLLVEQSRSTAIIQKSNNTIQKSMEQSLDALRKSLTAAHPVLSRIAPWMNSKLDAAKRKMISNSMWTGDEEAIKICLGQDLQQSAYFLNRNLTFMRDEKPTLLKKLKKEPAETFIWKFRIWFRSNWIVRNNPRGYFIQKKKKCSTSTRWPLWRLSNLFMRTLSWIWNVMAVLGVYVPLYSLVSLRAVLGLRSFRPNLNVNQNGRLVKSEDTIIPTLSSHLVSWWRIIFKSRENFELNPDTGFIDKSCIRLLNILWNYIFKGLICSLILILGFPILCILINISSIFLATTAPLWIPLVTLSYYAFMLLIYDCDCPNPSEYNKIGVLFVALLWNICVAGFIQFVAAVVACLLCPIISLLIFITGLVCYLLRQLWDAIMFQWFIKRRGRVPISDGFTANRIAGPGLSLNYYFLIKPEQALAAFEAHMEMDELKAYQFSIENIISQPLKDFRHFVETCLEPFSVRFCESTPYVNLRVECEKLKTTLNDKLEIKRKVLRTELEHDVKLKIKLNTTELKIVIQQAANMLERFYPSHVIPNLQMNEAMFWHTKDLPVNDWTGLAAHFYTEIFSVDFLTPLGEADKHFKLQSRRNLDLSRYTSLLYGITDVLDLNAPELLKNIATPKGGIQVHPPYLKLSTFDPQEAPNNSVQLPHLVEVAVSVYNCKTSQPIQLDSLIAWMVLKLVEEKAFLYPQNDDIGIPNNDDALFDTSSLFG